MHVELQIIVPGFVREFSHKLLCSAGADVTGAASGNLIVYISTLTNQLWRAVQIMPDFFLRCSSEVASCISAAWFSKVPL